VDRVVEEVKRTGPAETGGLLLGWRRGDLDLLVVAHVTGPGAGAKATPTRLRLDTAGLQKEVDEWFARTAGAISYLGDWHLHHAANPVPSPTDRQSAQEIATRPEIDLPQPLIVILGLRGGTRRWRAWVGPELIPSEIEFVVKG
jgi:integrative and conjugative element protein (TIGR02256 family)